MEFIEVYMTNFVVKVTGRTNPPNLTRTTATYSLFASTKEAAISEAKQRFLRSNQNAVELVVDVK